MTANGPSRKPSRLPKARRMSRRSKVLIAVGIGLVLLVGAGAVIWAKPFKRDVRADLVTHKVQFGRLELTIVERGALLGRQKYFLV